MDNVNAFLVVRNKFEKGKETAKVYLSKIEEFFLEKYKWDISYCKEFHNNPRVFYESGLLNFQLGNDFDFINDIKEIINNVKNIKDLLAKIILLKGQAEAELGLYHDAIISLSEAIQKDPINKNIYFDRAGAYFELGKFDNAISDFLQTNLKSQIINPEDFSSLLFAKGLISGILKGGKDGAVEFVPSALASLQGLSHGLWAFTTDPKNCSKQIVEASRACMEFIKDSSSVEIINKFIPELQELIENWTTINDEKKGNLTGYVIGKYGIDILMTSGSIKAVQAYRNLKKANNLFTLEKCLQTTSKNQILLVAEQQAFRRKEILKSSNLKIQWDKQGKHISTHKNFIEGRSLLEHSNPQKLINDSAGKGIKCNGVPGKAGYQEIVDFKEFIGYYVDQNGKKFTTTRGKIHYSNSGTHLVPAKPNNLL